MLCQTYENAAEPPFQVAFSNRQPSLSYKKFTISKEILKTLVLKFKDKLILTCYWTWFAL